MRYIPIMNSETKQGVRNQKENKMYEVQYSDHDHQEPGNHRIGRLVRSNLADAIRTEKLMKECGYRTTKIVEIEPVA